MTARLAMLMSLGLTALDPYEQPRARPSYGTRGKVGTSKKAKARRKRDRQNRKRGRS